MPSLIETRQVESLPWSESKLTSVPSGLVGLQTRYLKISPLHPAACLVRPSIWYISYSPTSNNCFVSKCTMEPFCKVSFTWRCKVLRFLFTCHSSRGRRWQSLFTVSLVSSSVMFLLTHLGLQMIFPDNFPNPPSSKISVEEATSDTETLPGQGVIELTTYTSGRIERRHKHCTPGSKICCPTEI